MNVRELIPQHKMDHEKTARLKKVEKDHLISIIPELMKWLQDGNWPVFPEVRDILIPLDRALLPSIKYVLGTNDGDWKYFVLSGLVSQLSRETIEELKQELSTIAYYPSESDKASEVDDIAKEILNQID